MGRSGMYIEDAGSYYKKRYGRRKWKCVLAKTVLGALLAVFMGSTAMNGYPGENGSIQTPPTVLARGAEDVSGGDLPVPVMDGMAYGENCLGEPKSLYLAGVAKEIPKKPEDILIVIDPGHGGSDEGCSRDGILEKDVNLKIAEAAESRLKELGYQVQLTRALDTGLTLEERVECANNAGADAYISIHQNACEISSVWGIETWYSAQKEGGDSRRLASLIQMYTTQKTGAGDRGVVEDESLYVTRETDMPSCLVETGFLSNAKERGELVSAEYQDRIVDGIVSGIDLFFFPKTMYLTFDDGPSAENTNTVLDILKEYNIKATFFVVGENVKKHPEVAKRIAEEGHTIGIHCNYHDYETLYESKESYLEDFEKAYDIVYETTGVEVKLFRFPGGSINAYNKSVYEDIISEMTDRGFIYFDWNASLEDATKHNDPETLLENARFSTLGRRNVVMLSHDIVYPTTLCLEELILQFPDYEFKPLTEEVSPIQF
ncbi:MAG: N-acetylmuramoyl-L-alanine amidase [Lachnospiraceae bacterium]|nr:N-acetylmuramoyl-L-alanine amidase [Lachnospiraceae bacterium]